MVRIRGLVLVDNGLKSNVHEVIFKKETQLQGFVQFGSLLNMIQYVTVSNRENRNVAAA